MKTLVTGGAGFIGSHLADALLAAGHQVTVVDDLSRGRRSRVPTAARFIQADVASDLRAVFAGSGAEVVFHLAAQIDVRRSISDPLLDTRVNVLGTVGVLQAAADTGVRRVVFASSGGTVYGDTDVLPTPETAPLRPASQYGAAKVAAELYGRVYGDLYGIDFVSLRYANVYGPRQDPHGEAGVVAIFSEKMLRGEVPAINGDGSQTRDYVYVADVVAANLVAIDGPPGAYNVGTGVECDVNELHRRLQAIIGGTAPATHGPAKAGEQRRSCLDPTLAASSLHWSPRLTLDEGLRLTVEYFRSDPGDR
ncbi:MAG: NAD-dependent epimerase/dehydratase family protein [Candidatus Dormibacteria bacterium]|jgi:UDP-glucose 4-epimerase